MSHQNNHNDLYHALQHYAGRDFTSFHMPGHKGRALFSHELPWHLDITEIHDFDNLHAPNGILQNAQQRAAALFQSDASFFLINGSTAGILAGIYATVNAGDKILMARNCHKSVYHAIELLDLSPVFLDPPQIEHTGVLASISPNQVSMALDMHPDIRLCILVSPTYEGVVSDISAISTLLKAHNIPLFVDEAHGAHFGLSPHFPESAITQGADLVVQSLHKTLPSLTQTAILHAADGQISSDRIRHALGIFQSTSPSYPLMSCIDSCVSFLHEKGASHFSAWHTRLEKFYAQAENLQHLRLLQQNSSPAQIFALDPGKITILCQNANITGKKLETLLRERYQIQLEMALTTHALAMSGMGNTEEDFAKLYCALSEIDKSLSFTENPVPPLTLPPFGNQQLSIRQALQAKKRILPFSKSLGQISASYVWVMPPCVPILIPGTEITAEVLSYLAQLDAETILQDKQIPAGFLACVDKSAKIL